MDPMTIGSIASGAGSILSGLGIGKKGYSAKDGFKQGDVAVRNAKLIAQQLPSAQKAGWEAAGIHPVYAMGGGSSFSSPITMSGHDSRPDFSAIGSGIDRAMNAGSDNMSRLQERLLSTQIEGQEIDNAYRASQMALQSHSQLPPAIPGVKHVLSKQEATMGGDYDGTAAGRNPVWQKYKGNTLPIWGPHAENAAEAMEGLGGSALMLPQYAVDGVLSFIRDNFRDRKKFYSRDW